MKKVFMVGDWGMEKDVRTMFEKANWKIVKKIEEADLVQFLGGDDVSPSLYNQKKHILTQPNEERDRFEILVYKAAAKLGKPMAGICRGGQFLNVMCGGSMWQHVNNHSGVFYEHPVFSTYDNTEYLVTSTHHQMMIPSQDGWVIDFAKTSTIKLKMNNNGEVEQLKIKSESQSFDPETVFYWDENCLCVQGHPEWSKEKTFPERYFQYIDELSMYAGKAK